MATPTDENANKKETEFLVYRGNNVPKVLRLAWTLLAIFIIYYLFIEGSFLKDLSEWMTKAKG
jgi:hypothetical protein